jgi:hypothetical protein
VPPHRQPATPTPQRLRPSLGARGRAWGSRPRHAPCKRAWVLPVFTGDLAILCLPTPLPRPATAHAPTKRRGLFLCRRDTEKSTKYPATPTARAGLGRHMPCVISMPRVTRRAPGGQFPYRNRRSPCQAGGRLLALHHFTLHTRPCTALVTRESATILWRRQLSAATSRTRRTECPA